MSTAWTQSGRERMTAMGTGTAFFPERRREQEEKERDARVNKGAEGVAHSHAEQQPEQGDFGEFCSREAALSRAPQGAHGALREDAGEQEKGCQDSFLRENGQRNGA